MQAREAMHTAETLAAAAEETSDNRKWKIIGGDLKNNASNKTTNRMVRLKHQRVIIIMGMVKLTVIVVRSMSIQQYFQVIHMFVLYFLEINVPWKMPMAFSK